MTASDQSCSGLCFSRHRWIVKDSVIPGIPKNQFYAFFRFFSATLRAGMGRSGSLHYAGTRAWPTRIADLLTDLRCLGVPMQPRRCRHSTSLSLPTCWLAHRHRHHRRRARWPVAVCVLAAVVVFMFGAPRLAVSNIPVSFSAISISGGARDAASRAATALHWVAVGFAISAAGVALAAIRCSPALYAAAGCRHGRTMARATAGRPFCATVWEY